MAPPPSLACPRDLLTVHEGRISAYHRTQGRTTLSIRTDAATTETVTLRHPGSQDPSAQFLLNRAPFVASDWARIETQPGRVRPGVRVAAWVCSNGTPPVIDWHPPAP